MKKVILLCSILLLTAACSDSDNKGTDSQASAKAADKPVLVSVESTPAELYLNNKIYRKAGVFKITSQEDVPAVASICFGQDPVNSIPDKKVLNAEEFSMIGFQKQTCTSKLINLKQGTNTYEGIFNMYEAINGMEGEQVIFGDTTVYAFIDGDYDTYVMLGNERLEEMQPHIALQRGIHESTFIPSLNNDMPSWSIVKKIEPEYINASALFEVSIAGKNIDSMVIESASGSTGIVDVFDKDNKKLGSINYVIENTLLEPAKVDAKLNDTNNQLIKEVQFKKFSTTNEETLPEVSSILNVKFKYSDIKQFMQTLKQDGTLEPSSLHPVYMNIPFYAVSNINGEKAGKSEVINVNFADVINDARDMFESIYKVEHAVLNSSMPVNVYFKGVAKKGDKPAMINKLTYEANKAITGGSDQFDIKGSFKAGLYVNQYTDTNKYQLLSSTNIDTHMDIFGTYFNIVNGMAEVSATPKFEGEKEDGRFDIKYNLTIMDKKVLDEASTVTGGYHTNKDFTFEKDFETSNTFVVVVPFYYNIGGRGTVGIRPAMDLEFMQKEIPSIMEVVKTTKVKNPAPKPEGELLDVSGLENVNYDSHKHYYPYEKLPAWAKTYVDSIGLEKSTIPGEEANVVYVMDPNSKLSEEYKNRVRHNDIINNYEEYISQIVTENVIMDKTPVGANIKFTARPYINISGYAGGGFGVDQSFSLAKFSLGVGASANINPILDLVIDPFLDGFIGIGHASATNKDYLLLNYGFKAPVTYEYLRGKAFVGAHVKMSIKLFSLWHDILDRELGMTLFEQMTPQKQTIDIIQPVNKTHGIELSL